MIHWFFELLISIIVTYFNINFDGSFMLFLQKLLILRLEQRNSIDLKINFNSKLNYKIRQFCVGYQVWFLDLNFEINMFGKL